MSHASAAPIAITMGDPSGVGAEVIVRALSEKSPMERAQYLVVGDRETMQRAIAATEAPIALSDDGAGGAIRLEHVPVEGLPGRFGVLSPACGEASFRYIERAVAMAQSGAAAG